MKVKDIMRSKVVSLHVGDTLDVVGDITDMGHIRHLPVVDAENRVVGIISQRDLFRATASSVLQLPQYKEQEWMHSIKVRDVMIPEVTTISDEAGMAEAVDKLVTQKFGCLPVVDAQGKLAGLLTETDCLRCFHGLLKLRTFQEGQV